MAAARWGDTGCSTRAASCSSATRATSRRSCRCSTGPQGTEAQVAQLYLDAQGRLLEAGMRLTAVRLDARGAWELELDNGVTVRLGRQAVDERLERFIAVASPVVAQRATEISYVDMRYTQRLRVGWNARCRAVAQRRRGCDDQMA